MRSFLLFTFFLLLACKLSAQYQPFVVDSAVWIIKEDDIVTTPWVDLYYGYYMHGDTLDGGNIYKKVYRLTFQNTAPTWPQPYQVSSMGLYALVRESSKKIYCKDPFSSLGTGCPVNSDFLLYDFNYNIGDTVNLCLQVDQDTVENIGMNFVYNRKNFITHSYHHEYIEGIGSYMGLFELVWLNVSTGVIDNLEDYCQGTLNECSLITSVNSPSKENFNFKVFPNPAQTSLNFRLDLEPHYGLDYYISITDLFGREIKKVNISDNSSVFQINIDFPDNGSYYCSLYSNKRLLKIEKLIVSK